MKIYAKVNVKVDTSQPIPQVKKAIHDELGTVPNEYVISFEDVKKVYPEIADKIKKFFFTKGGKITVGDLRKKLKETENTDKRFWMSEGEWEKTIQKKLASNKQIVVQLNFTPEMIAELKKDELAYKFLSLMASQDKYYMHPMINQSFAWARVYIMADAYVVEEIQSDYLGWEKGFKSMGRTQREVLDKNFTESEQKKVLADLTKHFDGWERGFLSTIVQMARKDGKKTWIMDESMKRGQGTTPSKLEWFYKKLPRDLGFKKRDDVQVGTQTWTVWEKTASPRADVLKKYRISRTEITAAKFRNNDLNDLYEDIKEYDKERLAGATMDDLDNYNDTNVLFTLPKRLTDVIIVRLSKEKPNDPLLGHENYHNLALTSGPMSKQPNDEDGLTFGFEEPYLKKRKHLVSKYGAYVQKYKVPEALKVEHLGDGEEQVIFQASAAKPVKAAS